MCKLLTSLVFLIAINLGLSGFAMDVETIDYAQIECIDQAFRTQIHVKFKFIVNDETAKYIAYKLRNNAQVESLHLCYLRIGPQGAFYIASALQENNHLKELYLDGNPIGDEGTKHFAKALETNKALQKLGLVFCDIDKVGIEYLTHSLTKNITLKELGLDSWKVSAETWHALLLNLEKRRL